MKYLIDTDICIHFFKGKFGLENKFRSIGIENCYVSELTIAELLYGAHYSQDIARHLAEAEIVREKFRVLPITAAIELYGVEKARLRKEGSLIETTDLFIAVTSVVHKMVMVTANTKHFKRIANIQLEDWTKTKHNEFR